MAERGASSPSKRQAPRKRTAPARKRTSSARSNGHRPSPGELARRTSDQLAELIGRDPEGVVSLERGDDGWRISIEVVETRRIPDTADVLAVYDVDVDEQGELVGYRRAHRYVRGRTGDGE